MNIPVEANQRGERAFSIVEVAIAVGIASLAITVILGLMPAGLESIRSAGVTSAQSSIFRQMFGEVQMADWGRAGGATPGWDGIAPFDDQRRYFDDQGTPITEDASDFEVRLAYVGRFSFPNNLVLVPGDGGGAAGTPDMVYLQVDIADVPLKNYDFDQGKRHRSRTMVVTRQHASR